MVRKNEKKTRSIVISLIESICPYIIKKIKQDDYFKNCLKMKIATVESFLDGGNGSAGSYVNIILPYDSVSFPALNNTGAELAVGDTVCFMYWIDLKNSVIMIKK